MDKPLLWLEGEIQTPPFSEQKRLEAGYYLRLLQGGQKLGMPHSKPLPNIGKNCHELRIKDEGIFWRINYKIESDAILILEVYDKKSNKIPKKIISACKERIKLYNKVIKGK